MATEKQTSCLKRKKEGTAKQQNKIKARLTVYENLIYSRDGITKQGRTINCLACSTGEKRNDMHTKQDMEDLR